MASLGSAICTSTCVKGSSEHKGSGREGGRWGYAELRLPLDTDRVQLGHRIHVQCEDSGVVYRGFYYTRAADRPGDVVTLHFELDVAAKPGSLLENIIFMTTTEWEEQRVGFRVEGSGLSVSWNRSNGASPGRPRMHCEEIVERLLCGRDGSRLELVRLKGPERFADGTEFFLCLRTFVQLKLQIRQNSMASIVHEYDVDPSSCSQAGVYDLVDRRSQHSLLIKVQPALGLQKFLPTDSTVFRAAEWWPISRRYALLGAYEFLRSWASNPASHDVAEHIRPPSTTSHIAQLREDSELMAMMQEILPCITHCEKTGALRVTDANKPSVRGKLIKMLFEVKMIIVQAVIRLETKCLEQHERDDFGVFKAALLTQDCCQGGVEAQFDPPSVSMPRLTDLICGSPLDGAAWDGAWNSLADCVAFADAMLKRLAGDPRASALKVPSMESVRRGDGLSFKHEFNRICMVAMQVHLHIQIVKGIQTYGREVATATAAKMWRRPDIALQTLFSNASLQEAIREWDIELERIMDCLCSTGALGNSFNPNPRGAIGLDNLGENLCATNSLLQIIFSASTFRKVVLMTRDIQFPPISSTGNVTGAKQLVEGLYKLFSEMVDSRRRTASARQIATVLYGQDIGRQQDSDELLHRLSCLLQDGLGGIQGDPCRFLRETFLQLFTGVTCEVHVRAKSAPPEDEEHFEVIATAANGDRIGYPLFEDTCQKQFLSIPVQPGNRNLTRALAEFTDFSSTGGNEVLWTREQFRSVPPFLLFSSRQVSEFEWEDCLNLTPFLAPSTPMMQQDCLERAVARQSRTEFEEAVRQLAKASDYLINAQTRCGQQMQIELEQLKSLYGSLEARIDAIDARIRDLDDRIGDGFNEPSVSEFLDGIVDRDLVEEKLCGFLGANTVKKLSDLYLGVDGAEDMLEGLDFSTEQIRCILDRLHARQKRNWTHVYDIHALVVYQGKGQVGHYVSFVRQADGAFLCFDDESVFEVSDARKIRESIRLRSSEAHPASVRMLVYRRRQSSTMGSCVYGEGVDQSLEMLGPRARSRLNQSVLLGSQSSVESGAQQNFGAEVPAQANAEAAEKFVRDFEEFGTDSKKQRLM